MKRVVEVRNYRLKPGKRGEFHALLMSVSLSMLQRWDVDVIVAGPSLDGEDDYRLIRAYASIEAMRTEQPCFTWVNPSGPGRPGGLMGQQPTSAA